MHLILRVVLTQFFLPYRIHQLIHLSNLLIAHLVHFALVHLFTAPSVAFNLLRIGLPFGEEADDVD